MIYSAKEAEYIAAYNEYINARAGFYDGTISPAYFIELRKEMEDALAAWEAE